ncbi:MAG: hypothetical protein JW772_01175 [Candidatus Diapherotrites archaeon]|nr:hypothetical protein [Candidatus Diapherotrites archaeon]
MAFSGCVTDDGSWYADIPPIKCKVIEIPDDLGFYCQSFESFDELFVSNATGSELTKFEFIESPGKTPLETLNNLEWNKSYDERPDSPYTTRIPGLYSDYGQFKLRINNEYDIIFEVVPSEEE